MGRRPPNCPQSGAAPDTDATVAAVLAQQAGGLADEEAPFAPAFDLAGAIADEMDHVAGDLAGDNGANARSFNR